MKARVERGQVSGRGVHIPTVDVVSSEPGPRVLITANLHGDECTGIGVIHRLLASLPERLLSGSVRLYPSLNPAGMMAGKRGFPGDAMDPNRSFPGSPTGTSAQRHAHRLWSDMLEVRPHALIDLHTDSSAAIPYALVDRIVRGSDPAQTAAQCQRMAEASGLTVLQEYPAERYRRFDLDRSLPGALVNGPGIPSVTLEVGPRRRVDEAAVDRCEASVYGILGELGLVEAETHIDPQRVCTAGWRRENGPRTGRVGVLVSAVRPGQRFARGELLAEVRSLDGGCVERLKARGAGFVISLPELCHAPIGTPCATIAVEDLP